MKLARRELIPFRKQLLGWYRQYQRPLPWRRDKDPYRIWLSEIMLQQTRVAAVIPYYERFLERFPDVNALAVAPEEEVLRLWSGLGYYSRARNLQRAAQEIVAKHAAVFPHEENDVLALPGVGRYTVAAILSIAYGAKRAVLDGNVARVLARIFALRGDLREGKRWQALQQSANELLDGKSPGDWNQAMMELGAVVCTPRAPQCLLCPVSKFCRAHELGIAEAIPALRRKGVTVEIALVAAVLLDGEGHTLLLPPPKVAAGPAADNDVGALVSKMWRFPTWAKRKDSTSEIRELLKDLLRTSSKTTRIRIEALPKVRHTVTFRRISVHGFRVRVARLPRVPEAKAISLEELCSLSSVPISNLTRKIARSASGKSALAAPASFNAAAAPAALLFRAATD